MKEQHFTNEGIKALEKMATEGAQEASGALSKLIGQKMSVATVAVRSVPIERVSEFIAQPEERVTTILMSLSGDVGGQIMLIYPQQSAVNVADFLAKRSLGVTRELDEFDKSALKESGNIIAGSFLAAISNYLNVNMIESTPDLATDMLKATVDTAIAKFVGAQPSEAIAMEINFGMSTPETSEASKIVPELQTKGYFILLLDISSAKKVMTSLKGISGGERMIQRGGDIKE